MQEYNRETLFDILNNNGIFFDETNLEALLEMDSITFVTLIVDIENSFGIEYPNEMMVYDNNVSVLRLEEIIQSLLA